MKAVAQLGITRNHRSSSVVKNTREVQGKPFYFEVVENTKQKKKKRMVFTVRSVDECKDWVTILNQLILR